MKSYKIKILFLSLFFISIAVPASAEFTMPTKIVPDCATKGTTVTATSNYSGVDDSTGLLSTGGTTSFSMCGYADLIQLFKNIMDFMLWFSSICFVIAVAYAGFLYVTAMGEMGKIEKAHGIFSKAITGLLFVLLGWLIVATILKTLNVKTDFSGIDHDSVKIFTTNGNN